MPSARSDSRPSPIASAKRFRWVRLRTCTTVASARVAARRAQPLDRPVLLVRLLQAPQAVQRRVAAGAHLDQRGGLVRVDQPQRGGQQRVHQRVVADQPRLVGGAPQQPHHLTALRRVVDGVDHRQVLLRRDREQLRHPGQPPRHRQLQGASPLRVQPAQDRPRGCGRGGTAPPVAPRAPSPAGPRPARAPAAAPPRPPARRSRSAARSARPARPGRPSPPPAARDARRQGLDPRRQQPGQLGPAQAGAHRRRRPTATRRPSRSGRRRGAAR